MKARPVRFGALSLLLAVIVIVLAVLAVLSYATAHASKALADKQVTLLSSTSDAQTVGQTWLSKVDAVLLDAQEKGLQGDDASAFIEDALPSGTTYVDGMVSASLDCGDGHTLQVAVRVDDDLTYEIMQWKTVVAWEPDRSGGGLQAGIGL